jgi:peptidoglycan/LPS O-acetylase OafA/YrhL
MAFLISVFLVGLIGAPDPMRYLRALHVGSELKDLLMLRMPNTPPTFAGSHYPAVNGPLWTIRFEFMCYLLILGLGLLGALRGKFLLVALWAISLVAFLAVRFSERHLAGTGAIAGGTILTLARFVPIFLSGAVLYKTSWHLRRPIWLIALALAVLVAGLCNKVTAEAALASAGAYLLVRFGGAVPKPRGFVKFPDISYGVYLYGWPSQKLVIYFGAAQTPLAVFGLSLAMAMCLAWLSWKFIEAPALRLKDSKLPTWPSKKRWLFASRFRRRSQ